MMEIACKYCMSADILIVIGTSMQVYPAASLIQFVQSGTQVYFVDPKPNISMGSTDLKIIPKKATEGVEDLRKLLL